MVMVLTPDQSICKIGQTGADLLVWGILRQPDCDNRPYMPDVYGKLITLLPL